MTQRVRLEELKKSWQEDWGPFHLTLLISAAVIIALLGVIIRGGEPPPPRTIRVIERPTLILFLVDGALRRCTHYEGTGYPERLSDLPVKYMPIKKEDFLSLEMLSYSTDATEGYRLSLTDRDTGDVIMVLSPQGIVDMSSSEGES